MATSAETAAAAAASEGLAGNVTLSAEALLSVLSAGEPVESQWSARVLSVAASGSTMPKQSCVSFSFEFEVMLNEQTAWTSVDLLPGTLTVLDVQMLAQPDGATAHVVERGRNHALLARAGGLYRVLIKANCPFVGKSRSHVSLWLPSFGRGELNFVVYLRENVQVTAESALDGVTSTADGNTTFRACLQPTNNLSVRWTEPVAVVEVVVPDAPKAEPAKLSITVEQQHLFSVGEGMLISSSRVKYDIRNGTVAVFDICIDPRLRILSVDGANGPRWEVLAPAAASAAAAADAPASPVPVLRVSLNQAIEGAYDLFIESELELGGTTCEFACPVFAHQPGQCVSRELGFIGVEARTNVEVDQPESPSGCVLIDIGELSADLRGMATQPILLAYKYLQPSYDLKLSVKRHGDVSVCVALVEAAAFTVTATEHGRVMKKLVLKVRNSARQYIRVYLSGAAGAAELWSTSVAGKPVKPANDGQAVLIPLKKEATAKRQNAFTVEMVWVDPPQPAMGARGELLFELPKVDLPINQLFVSVYVPSAYRYGEFTGDLRECQAFSGVLPEAPSSPHAENQSDDDDEEQEQGYRAPRLERAYSMSLNMDDAYGGGEAMQQMQRSYDMPKAKKKAVPAKGRAGVVPVRVDMVTAGRRFTLERLLLTPDEAELRLQLPYRRKSQRETRI